MNMTNAACGHSVLAVGAPGSNARQVVEQEPCDNCKGMYTDYIDVVFDGPPGPEGGRFVEVEDSTGKSIQAGNWIQRADGYWVLRIGN